MWSNNDSRYFLHVLQLEISHFEIQDLELLEIGIIEMVELVFQEVLPCKNITLRSDALGKQYSHLTITSENTFFYFF